MRAIRMTRSDYMLLYNLIMLQIDYKNDYHYLFARRSPQYYFINHQPHVICALTFHTIFYIMD